VPWKELGIEGKCAIRDLWEKKNVGQSPDSFTFHIPPHGAVMVKLTGEL
jgi:hypothetical protein